MLKKVFGMISLGCDKNRVDGERILGEIKRYGCEITDDISRAEVLVVNTCAFLNAAREESIQAVLEGNGYRGGKLEKIVVTGCLPEKFIGELFPALTEGDVFLGVNDVSELFPALEKSYAEGRVNAVGTGKRGCMPERVITTAPHIKYLKIADGCFNHCTYCLIPKIRGKYVSYPMEELVEEARSLGETEELVLVAQDTTRYGEDRGANQFVNLIKKISELDNICHIRLLYCYPEVVTDALIAEIRDNPKVIKYLDIPLQHSENRILKLMGRRGSREDYLALFSKLRKEIPDIAIRTTFIAGFPSETEEDHAALLSFLEEAKFENCGFFAYSREPETPAYKLPGQIPARVKQRRVRALYRKQEEISRKKLSGYEGKTVSVVCDGVDFERGCFTGRAYFQAPDIDGCVHFTAAHAETGKRYRVTVDRTDSYDLYGAAEEE
ncbi:MAG: 30S ribosomal protein S12 methylthiotransferase RimO [Clostridia bacterium]|nr:30S ribosomal protein S12 methylthiotransferase RimO [Clostridia bacterium]